MTEKYFNDIAENIKRIRGLIEQSAGSVGREPSEISLMAVTKTVPADIINIAVGLGVKLLGENRAQELLEKYDKYNRENASIHFIGRLQTNKVRQIIEKVDMIHSLDSLKLAAEINKRSAEAGKVMDALIEINVGDERSKSGIGVHDAQDFYDGLRVFSNIRVRGLMTIPPICDNIQQSERYFSVVRQLFIDMKAKNRDNSNIDILSMGMSDDFEAAIRHGSTIVRIGSAIFGKRTV